MNEIPTKLMIGAFMEESSLRLYKHILEFISCSQKLGCKNAKERYDKSTFLIMATPLCWLQI